MRIAVIAPPWYTVPPSGYGGIEWVVALLADGAYLHGPFTDQTSMLYRRIARRHWFMAISESQRSMGPPNLRWGGVVHNGIPMDRYPFREDKEDFLFFWAGPTRRRRPIWPSRRPDGAGRRLVICVTTKNERERAYWAEQVEPLLGDDVEVRGECDQTQKTELLARAAALLFPIQWPEPFGLVMTEAMACGTPVLAWRNGSVPEVIADGETGFVVASVEEMSAAVDRLDELDRKPCGPG
jgi:Glycosyl transferases group 1